MNQHPENVGGEEHPEKNLQNLGVHFPCIFVSQIKCRDSGCRNGDEKEVEGGVRKPCHHPEDCRLLRWRGRGAVFNPKRKAKNHEDQYSYSDIGVNVCAR